MIHPLPGMLISIEDNFNDECKTPNITDQIQRNSTKRLILALSVINKYAIGKNIAHRAEEIINFKLVQSHNIEA